MLIKENSKENICSAQDVINIMRPIYDARQDEEKHKEYCYTIGMDAANRILYIDLAGFGTLDKASIYPREVIRMAVLKNAKRIILVHNHPTGQANPSSADTVITQKISKGGDLLDVELQDHLILAEGEFYSFKDKGLI